MQGNVVKVGGTCKNLLDSLCMINVQNGRMEYMWVGEHSVHARLDSWIWSENCGNTLLWHEGSTSECTK